MYMPSALEQPGDAPLVSLILATVDRSEELQTLWVTLASQADRDFEVIVVDQNSDDRLGADLARARDQGLRILHLKAPRRGLAAARNVGLDAASGAFVAFPDDDCWYERDTLEKVRSALARRPGIDGVVGRWVEEDPDGKRPGHVLSFQDWQGLRGGDASSICLFLRRALVDRIGRFDDRLGVGRWYGAGEETDLVLRALRAKGSLEYVPAVRIHHRLAQLPERPDLRLYRDARRRARGAGALYAKHRMSAWVVLRGLASPVIKAVLSRRPLSGLILGVHMALGRFEGLMRWHWQES